MKLAVTVALAVVLGTGYVGCGTPTTVSVESARAAFRIISNEKKARITQFLLASNSDLHDYQATVTEETDLEKSLEYPYVGRITFQYRVSHIDEKSDEDSIVRWYATDELTAAYRYSARDRAWVYDGATQSDAGDRETKEPDPRLVSFDAVRAAFEAR